MKRSLRGTAAMDLFGHSKNFILKNINEIRLTSSIRNLKRILWRSQYCTFQSNVSHTFGTCEEMLAPLILINPTKFRIVRKKRSYDIVIFRTMYYVKKESEVVRENRSYRTVWNQCCHSPWVGQTQKSSVRDVIVNSLEMNAGLRPALPRKKLT